jgi:hypothetical protein
MNKLELKKLESELARVVSSRQELELKIMMLEEDIERIKTHVEIQLKKELEIKNKMIATEGEI